jgi:hypothetical protein
VGVRNRDKVGPVLAEDVHREAGERPPQALDEIGGEIPILRAQAQPRAGRMPADDAAPAGEGLAQALEARSGRGPA